MTLIITSLNKKLSLRDPFCLEPPPGTDRDVPLFCFGVLKNQACKTSQFIFPGSSVEINNSSIMKFSVLISIFYTPNAKNFVFIFQ